MPFWNSELIIERGDSLIEGFNPLQVAQGAYEMRLGEEAFVTGGDPELSESLKKVKLENEGDQLVIPPGQFALLLTDEKVFIPDDAIGLISMRSSYKLHGMINVSGFHVDPGFEGRLLFSVYNAGGNHIILSRGERVFLIWWASLSGATTDLYERRVKDGGREGQDSIANSDILQIGHTAFSPAAVNRRLEDLEVRFNSWESLGVNVVSALIGAAVGGAIGVVVALLA